MRRVCALLLCLAACPAWAEIVVPARTIRAREIIAPDDLVMKSAEVPGALTDPARLVGQEARVALYAGRPIRPGDVVPPAVVDRNQPVTLVFDHGALIISTEGRALGRGAVGEVIRVMNLSSRTTVSGRVRSDGAIEVQ
ncbi:flagella basal body P-ring formation protein FlgA [Cribrihabitans marinus]|uniref:Flagella basal body P-ring formation protein FlgA n=1 Tax=Cribrihabitans marinus TaxID=1227549 RepID=A0A1H7DKH2_9RHOB|nr:flagellar basal body P-ring formation chaperone FlgA [Cribrihabitans marinus]GGH39490.1 flagella basal body P-ring formation protein FlgA [Cribrihabitans marinus]SEK01407.1 flagella basal body P-ring formation protein FlgA [Cribrihabitans marinus]